jgi:hypothetical protein
MNNKTLYVLICLIWFKEEATMVPGRSLCFYVVKKKNLAKVKSGSFTCMFPKREFLLLYCYAPPLHDPLIRTCLRDRSIAGI